MGDSIRGSIALDDIQMEDGSCIKDICDFESEDVCGYLNDTLNTNFNWTRNKGPTDSFNTGYIV